MNTDDVGNETSPTPRILGFLVNTTQLVPLSPVPTGEKPDPLHIIIALICIFLLLATCLIFVTLCKPAALDQARYGPHECMPYHPEDASEPQLRFWKRLGSLRRSITSFRRTQPVSQHHWTCSRTPPAPQDSDFMESTKM
ncbi:uncharacterized protein C10orf105 homolog [Pelodiscus sinensis]|uniref:Chromosome 10 open reading frame 105 n=1 Tax=Pelodiscus sinensis TaxID=13735 RepID=K7EZA9_PELSI|nr:uncharacterized protein C10orf105 homolog [Pelodiscus sinensis]XP_014428222.1 uncharacterized protein C10orf105 homolog [Pelodiscus sinensis]XP_014428223.1 uncharacterized protein C10orf105 homolog [Pelodiscus sinensis]|eukprot:XP_014428220.1 uncharacterized protein C10orf105 homolog [Pelodiscus sinensis]